jgi:hypothetical protein
LWRDGKGILKTPEYTLDGTFKNDFAEGYATISWEDGS